MNKKPLDKILTFIPYYKHVIWGGKRISELKGEFIDSDNIGESWEISSVPGHETTVASGAQQGLTVNQLIELYGDSFLGSHVSQAYGNMFPLLFKIIDANHMLSLQVHPDDKMAAERHNSLGKTEMWYIIDAAPKSQIYCGLNQPLTPESFSRHIAEKSIMDIVRHHDAEPGQFYFLPPGTIHSIGAGNLLVEVQQSSDITYRVYDHDRRDENGKLRQLHTEEARDAIDYNFHKVCGPVAKKFSSSNPEVVSCGHFTVGYHDINGNTEKIKSDDSSFTVIMIATGDITIHADDTTMTLKAGHTALIPAYVKTVSISGTGRALTARV